MQAKDFMTTDVITVDPESDVSSVAQTFLNHRISAAPVVEQDGVVVGIVSEGDLMRRARPAARRSWWLSLVADSTTEFVRDWGTRVRDIMTPTVVSISGETSLSDVARILESNNIKRVPVIEEGRLVGLVSRADILRCLAALGGSQDRPTPEDHEIREKIIQLIRQGTEAWMGTVKVIVTKGEVYLWGTVDRKADADAVRVAAESVAGMNKVHNHLSVP
jgi:CBS domain-containing protein